MSDRPIFSIQPLDYWPGYVVIATWPDGKSEQLAGIYTSSEDAEQWIRGRSGNWLASRSINFPRRHLFFEPFPDLLPLMDGGTSCFREVA
jgi:hypothetical protein